MQVNATTAVHGSVIEDAGAHRGENRMRWQFEVFGPPRFTAAEAPPTGADEVPAVTTGRPRCDREADGSVSSQTEGVLIDGTIVAKGSKVRLRPSGRADAQDMFLACRIATVEAVMLDVDGSRHLAVTVDDDPGTALRREQGRYWYFAPDDVEPL